MPGGSAALMDELEKVNELGKRLKEEGLEDAGVCFVLGSGLGDAGDFLSVEKEIPYSGLPWMAGPTVPGHKGRLFYGRIGRTTCIVLSGRLHLYEGHSPSDVVRLPRAVRLLGCNVFVLTNAAGGIREDIAPGDLMLITDHLNMQFKSPLSGRHTREFGPRFPDQTYLYDIETREILKGVPSGKELKEGVYMGKLGPEYETPAEIRMARVLGADAVGMSTVLEATALNAMGARVGGISVISNKAAGLSGKALTHEEVVRVVSAGSERLKAIFREAASGLSRLGRK